MDIPSSSPPLVITLPRKSQEELQREIHDILEKHNSIKQEAITFVSRHPELFPVLCVRISRMDFPTLDELIKNLSNV